MFADQKGSSFHVVTPKFIIVKGAIYIGLFLATLVLLVGISLWLYNQQAAKAEFLYKQQIPFIKNNAELMKSVADLENQLVAQQLAITHEEVNQPLENVKQAWLEIVDLSRQHVLMVNDSLEDNAADEIAVTAQEFAGDYREFVILVDDLVLIRQSRIGQYKANTITLDEIIAKVDKIRIRKKNELTEHSYVFINMHNRVNTGTINSMIGLINDAQYYQYIYQELLKIKNQLLSLSAKVTPYQLNIVSTQIANLTKNINEELKEKSTDEDLIGLIKEISDISNQFMGAGQLFSKWQNENKTTVLVIEQLSSYRNFLKQTAELIKKPSFYNLPEFELNLPFIGMKVKESTIQPIGFLFVIILLSTSTFLAWRIMVLINRSYLAGAYYMHSEDEMEADASLSREHQLRSDKIEAEKESMVFPDFEPLKETKQVSLTPAEPIELPKNDMVMNLDKFNTYHGSAEMALFMLDDYMERNRQNYLKLKDALAADNPEKALVINAAILKTATILSAPRLIVACEKIDVICNQRDMDEAESSLIEMHQSIEEISDFVEKDE